MSKHLFMLSTPRNQTKPSWQGTTLRFRHPWVTSDGKYGIDCSLSVGKLAPAERGQIEEQLNFLLKTCPRKREDVRVLLYERLADRYFNPFRDIDTSIPVGKAIWNEPPKDATEEEERKATQKIVEMHSKVDYLQAEKVRLEQVLADMQTRMDSQTYHIGQQDLKANRLCAADLETGLNVFIKDYNPLNIYTRRTPANTIRQFKEVVGNLLLKDISPTMVDDFLDSYPDPTTQVHKRAHLSVFFKCCKRRLKLNTTPFTDGMLKTRKRVTNHKIDAIGTPEQYAEIVNSYKNLKWKTFVAFAILAGPRKAEQLTIKIADLNLTASPPTVYLHRPKTRDVALPIERNHLLPLLKEYLATLPKGQVYLWANERGEPYRGDHFYYAFYRAKGAAILAPADFVAKDKEILEKTKRLPVGVKASKRREEWAKVQHTSKPHLNYTSREFRHSFGTILSKCGYDNWRISQLMANSPAVVATNYNGIAPVDANIKGYFRWHD